MTRDGSSEVQRTARYVDYSHVELHHRDIDGRLQNWAAWCRSMAGTSGVHPMFRQYRPALHWDQAAPRYEVDPVDAYHLERAVGFLPIPQREALRWCYVHRGSPGLACRAIGVRRFELQLLVHSGRQMLVNRRV